MTTTKKAAKKASPKKAAKKTAPKKMVKKAALKKVAANKKAAPKKASQKLLLKAAAYTVICKSEGDKVIGTASTIGAAQQIVKNHRVGANKYHATDII